MTVKLAPMRTDVHPTAIIMPHAEIGKGYRIGAFSVIGDPSDRWGVCQMPLEVSTFNGPAPVTWALNTRSS